MILTNCRNLENLLDKTQVREFVVIADDPKSVNVPQGVNALIIPSLITHFPGEKLASVKEIFIAPGTAREVLALCAIGLFSVGIPISFTTEGGTCYESIYDVVDLTALWPKFAAHMLEILARKYDDLIITCQYDEDVMLKEYESLSAYVREVNKAYDKLTEIVNNYTKKKLDDITQ